MQVRILVGLALWFVFGIAGAVLLLSLRRYRVDLQRDHNAWDGASWLPPVNYLSRTNYSAKGQRLLRWLWAWHLAALIAFAVIGWLVLTAV